MRKRVGTLLVTFAQDGVPLSPVVMFIFCACRRWPTSGPLTELRKQFQEAGFREQERAITYALYRSDADPSDLRASVEERWKSLRGKKLDEASIVPLRLLVEATF